MKKKLAQVYGNGVAGFLRSGIGQGRVVHGDGFGYHGRSGHGSQWE